LNSLVSDVNTGYPVGSFRDPLTSDSANWQSLHLRIRELAPFADPVELRPFCDPVVRLVLNRSFHVDFRSEGRWREIKHTRGTGMLTPAGQTPLLRLRFERQSSFAILALFLPQRTVDAVALELSRPGTSLRSSLSDIPFLNDRFIDSFSSSVVAALRGGAPDFYAKAAAQWLAAHLLLGPSRGFEWRQSLARERISDYRLARVLEYIDAHLSERLDLCILSREAGISPFHFAALFSKAVGATPHRHVLHLRMQAAKSMLRETDKTALDIALTCGFGSASHFAAAFRRQFSQSPTEYRSSHHSSGYRLSRLGCGLPPPSESLTKASGSPGCTRRDSESPGFLQSSSTYSKR
jgi:AraC family transcriptional regulator